MDPEIVEQLNEQFREMSDILSQQNSLMEAQVRNMRELTNSSNNSAGSVRDNTSATDDNTRSTRSLSDEQNKTSASVRALGAGLDFASRSVMAFGKTVMDNNHNFQKYGSVVDVVTGSVDDLGKRFGIVGQVLGGIVKAGGEMLKYQLVQADSLLKFNDSVSKLGAVNSFSSNQISEMGLKAGFAAKDLDKLTAPIEKLGSTFKIIGTGASDSTKKFMEMAAVSTDTRQEFQRLGYSQTELVEAQAGYIELLGGSGLALRSFNGDVKALQKTSLEYVKNLQILSEMSGLTAEEQQKRMSAAAADTQFQLYIADMNKKIAAATTEEEKIKLTNQVELAMATKAQITALQGEEAGRGYGQALAGAPITEGLDTMAVSGTLNKVQELADQMRAGNISSAQEAARYTQAITNSSAAAQDSLKVAAAISSDVTKLVGGTSGIAERNRLFNLDQEKVAADLQKRIDENKEGKGPVAQDEGQQARNKLTEAEIKLRTEFDRFNYSISLAVPAMNTMATAANAAADALKAIRPPKDVGSDIFAGILAAAGLGIAGLGIFKGMQGMNLLRGLGGRGTSAPTVPPSTNAKPGASTLPRTPSVLTDSGKTYTRTPGGVLMPQGMDTPDSTSQSTKSTKPSMLSRLSGSGKYLKKLGGGIGGMVGGIALDAGADMAAEAGYTKTSGALSAASYAATGAGLGALLGPLGALAGGVLGGAYGLYQNWDTITGKKTPQQATKSQQPQQSSLPGADASFNRSVISFGRLVTSFGKIVTAYGKTTIGFIKASKRIEKSLDGLGQLSAVDKSRSRNTLNINAFNRAIARFGDIVTSFGKITSLTNKQSPEKSVTLLGTMDQEEEETLVDYIEKLKSEFQLTTEASSFMRDEEMKRHNFNEMSMLKFRQSIEDITKKFNELARSSLFDNLNGGADTGSGAGGVGSSSNAEKAMDYFMQQGWTKEQAAGIVGNLQQESTKDLDPRAQNATGHYGLAQWDTARRKEFENVMGKSIYDSTFEEQLAFIQHELTKGKEKAAGEKLRTARTASEAATIFEGSYERANGHALNQRIANAEALMRDDPITQQTHTSKAIAEFGKTLERQFGVKVSEHSAFDGKTPKDGHSPNSQHYKDLALDINAPQGGVKEWHDKKWKEKFDQIAEVSRQQGYRVLWGDDDHKDHLHVEVPKIKAAQGGVFDGPSAGYPAELHGSEMVAPLDTNSILMKLATTPASTNTGDMTATTSTIQKEIIEKISNTNQETMQALIDKFDNLINAIEEGNSVRDKMYKSSMI